MFQPIRFGRRLAIPSKHQIIHEMRMLQAEEERVKAALLSSPEAAGSTGDDLHPTIQGRMAGV